MEYQISPEQVEHFKQQGYLILPSVFNNDEISRMKDEADYILELILNSSVANQRRSGRLEWVKGGNGEQYIRKIQPINDLSLWLAQVSADPRFVTPMRQIMNDEPMLMEEKLNYKQLLPTPVSGLEGNNKSDVGFPIHHDWAYYAEQNYPQDIISSAITIDECTPDNGSLHIWPGSHLTNLEHVQGPLGWEVKEGLIDPDGGIDALAPPGSILLFHSLLAHNSRSNDTDRPRRLMIYSHYPKSFPICFDVRNGPTRLREAPWEHAYIRKRNCGEFTDIFRAPQYE